MKPVETYWNSRLGFCQLLLLIDKQEEDILILTSNLVVESVNSSVAVAKRTM